jgi:predicted phage terminase large subunit-like protein
VSDAALETDAGTEIRAEQAAQVIHQVGLRSNPIAFARHLGFEPAAHHELLLRAVKQLADDEIDVLLIAAPPGSAKSTYGSVVTPAWLLARDPRADVLLLGATATLVERFSRRVRNLLREPKWSYAAKGNVTLADDSSAVSDFATSAGGGLRAFGVGASILGNRADLAIIDDAVASFEVAMSNTQLEKLAEWLKSDVISRLKPRGKIIAIQQRMAHGDAFGFLDRYFERSNLRIKRIVLKLLAEEGDDDPLGRSPGEPLWPEWFNEQHIERAMLDPLRFSIMCQQRPVVGINEWASPDLLRIEELEPDPSLSVVYGVSDFATGAGAVGDYTCHAAIAITQDASGRKHMTVIDLFRRRLPPNEGIDAMISMVRRHGIRHWLIDDDFFAKTMRSFINERVRTSEERFTLLALPMNGQNKETRASALRAMLHEGLVHALNRPWVTALQEEIGLFPLGGDAAGVDDQIDAIGLLPRYLSKASVPVPDTSDYVEFVFPDGTKMRGPRPRWDGWSGMNNPSNRRIG